MRFQKSWYLIIHFSCFRVHFTFNFSKFHMHKRKQNMIMYWKTYQGGAEPSQRHTIKKPLDVRIENLHLLSKGWPSFADAYSPLYMFSRIFNERLPCKGCLRLKFQIALYHWNRMKFIPINGNWFVESGFRLQKSFRSLMKTFSLNQFGYVWNIIYKFKNNLYD